MTKLCNSCSLTQSKSGPDPKFVKHFAIRIQSKINKIRHSPDPVRSKSSPMLISRTDCHILRSRSSPEFSKLIPSSSKIQNFWKLKVKVQIRSKKLTKYSFLTTNITQFFSSNSVQFRLWSKFMKQFTVRSNPDSTKFGVFRIQPSPNIQCSLFMRNAQPNDIGMSLPSHIILNVETSSKSSLFSDSAVWVHNNEPLI